MPPRSCLPLLLLLAVAVVLAACAGEPLPAPAPLVTLPGVAPPVPLPPPPAPAPPLPAPRPDALETVLDPAALGTVSDGFTTARLDDGLLVVRNLPAAAFLVTRDGGVRPLPHLFDGLHSPLKDLAPLDFSVWKLRGSLADLAFTMTVPSSGEERDVRGRAGAWKVSGATPRKPVWIDEAVVAPPLQTGKGARLFQRAPGYMTEARRGFRFVFEGPPKGEKLPVPAAGKNGCTYRLLGHPFLAVLPDGALIGVSTECTSGKDLIPTGKVEGVGWPYQTLYPRLGHGHLAVERWKDGASTVDLLPGAEVVADYAGAEISARSADDLAVISQIAAPGDGRAYVAHFDGRAWSDITPEGAPFSLTPHRTRDGVLHLFAAGVAHRRTHGGWEKIQLELGAPNDRCKDASPSDFVETDAGELFLRALSGCVWRLSPGALTARRLFTDEKLDLEVRHLEVLGDWLYALIEHGDSARLVRLRL